VALLLPINANVDIYRGFYAGHPYPGTGAQPAVKSVGGYIRHHVRNGRFGYGSFLHWTTLLYLPLGTDIRSAYNTELNTWNPDAADTVILADYPMSGWCTAFLVVLVQRVNRGQAGDCLRVHLDRMAPIQGLCFQGCCPDPWPATLHATVPVGSGCPCLDGTVVTLSYSGGTNTWSGSANVCSDELFTIVFQCGGVSCSDSTLTVDFENHGTVGPITPVFGCACSPINVAFIGIQFPTLGGECDGDITVVVTV
jgi:hypothetical protein